MNHRNLSPLNGNRINKHSFAVTINSSAVTAADKLQYKIVPVFGSHCNTKIKTKTLTKDNKVQGRRGLNLSPRHRLNAEP